RCAQGEDARARMMCVAAEIHGGIELEAARQAGDLRVRFVKERQEAIERGLHPLSQLVADIRAECEGREQEVGAVVRLEELGGEPGDYVIAEISRKIADAQ